MAKKSESKIYILNVKLVYKPDKPDRNVGDPLLIVVIYLNNFYKVHGILLVCVLYLSDLYHILTKVGRVELLLPKLQIGILFHTKMLKNSINASLNNIEKSQ